MGCATAPMHAESRRDHRVLPCLMLCYPSLPELSISTASLPSISPQNPIDSANATALCPYFAIDLGWGSIGAAWRAHSSPLLLGRPCTVAPALLIPAMLMNESNGPVPEDWRFLRKTSNGILLTAGCSVAFVSNSFVCATHEFLCATFSFICA
eukprot:GGOE01023586.1.p1 GENE.GGOE01023586.1~~GGOE01023586.1.p1  ORF type:complete len:153 (+),score=1.72 GGOE01023586.1:654-1112(+)